jgi:Beta-lactamase enzyme family
VARFLAAALLVLAAAAVAVAATSMGGDEDDKRPRGAIALVDRPYPELQRPSEIAPPSQRASVALGVYPALRSHRRLTFPSKRAIRAARRYAAAREGRVSFAVVARHGVLMGWDARRTYQSASLVKAMILVAYLRKLADEQREPSGFELERMDAMIRVSDNDAASDLYGALGPEPLERLAADAGMREFGSSAFWGSSLVSAADQARFFIGLERLVPAEHRAYARDLLKTVAHFQSWGIPEAARPYWRVFFKGGWRPDDYEGQIVHQAALLERGARRVGVAVLTDLNPSESYGHDSIRGVTARLLRAPRGGRAEVASPGLLAPLPVLEDYRAPGPKPLGPVTSSGK